jgi:hypothetical protein
MERSGARGRAPQAPIEALGPDRNFFGAVAELGADVVHGAGVVFDRVAGLFDAAPARSAQQSAAHALEPAETAAQETAGQEKDAYLAMIMAPPAAEADRSVRAEQEPEAGQRRGPRL